MSISLGQGTALVKYARAIVESDFSGDRAISDSSLSQLLSEKRGVFVTLKKLDILRGCIGIPEPVYVFDKAIHQAAHGAAFEDPRFNKLREEELDKITVEVSVLTPPQMIVVEDPREYVDHIKIGRDGLIAGIGMRRGLLLPQVPVELGWDSKTFLEHTCQKAGLYSDDYMKPNFILSSFSGEVFCEKSPRGEVVEEKLI